MWRECGDEWWRRQWYHFDSDALPLRGDVMLMWQMYLHIYVVGLWNIQHFDEFSFAFSVSKPPSFAFAIFHHRCHHSHSDRPSRARLFATTFSFTSITTAFQYRIVLLNIQIAHLTHTSHTHHTHIPYRTWDTSHWKCVHNPSGNHWCNFMLMIEHF